MVTLGLPGPLSNAVDEWSEYADQHVSHVAKAAGFVHFSLSIDAESGRRTVEPRHYVISFPLRDQGRQKHQSALFTLRVVHEEEISRDPNTQGAVANHLRYKPPAERKLIPGADEYVEFELLSREHEVPSHQPLRISMGPVRVDKQTGQKEFVRVDMGQCIKNIANDIIEDPLGKKTRLVQNRWWMCIETLRLLCHVDSIDCSALDKTGVPPQVWVIRLMDTHAPVNKREELEDRPEERDIDDLMQFIDSRGPGRGCSGREGGHAPQRPPRKGKKKGGREKDPPDSAQVFRLGAEALWGEARPRSIVVVDDTEDGIPGTLICDSMAAALMQALDADAEFMETPTVSSAAVPSAGSSRSDVSSSSNALATALPVPQPDVMEDAADTDLMGHLLCRYRRLQETSGRIETNAKVAVIRELLEVLDELERADAEMEEDSVASRVIFSAARKFEAKLRGLGLARVEALGKPFSKTLHRVVGCVPEEECRNRVVVEELESGWVLGEDIVRPALVALG